MIRKVTIAAIVTTILWGCGPRGSAFGDWHDINGPTIVNGPLAVHGSLTVDGPAIIHGIVRAHNIKVNGPMLGTLPANERVGDNGRQIANATSIHGVLKVRGSLDVDGDLMVNGPLICEKSYETPQVAMAIPQTAAQATPERHVFGFTELQHFLGLPLK